MDFQTYTHTFWAPEQDWRTEIAEGTPNRSKQLHNSENVKTKNSSTHGNDSTGVGKVRKRNPWTSEEDKLLLDLTTNHGTTNWTFISAGLPNRSGKQCRERFHNHLCGNIEKGAWTDEEDKLLLDLQKQYGNQWAKVTKMLPGRTENAVKNHWWTAIRRNNRMIGSVKRIVTEVGSDYEENDEDRSTKTHRERLKGELPGSTEAKGALKDLNKQFVRSNDDDVNIGDDDVDVCNEHVRTSTLVSKPDGGSKTIGVENEDKCNAVDSNKGDDSGQDIDDTSDASLEELDEEDFMSSMKEAASKTSSNAIGFKKKAVDSARVSMSLPAIKKFREDLETEISNKQKWKKRPVQDRQAVFNEIKAISKLLHEEDIPANMARNLGWKGKSDLETDKHGR